MNAPDLLMHGERSLSDLIESERRMRQVSEETSQSLRNVLASAASRLDGTRLEDMRRGDARVPGNWNASQWQMFFESIPVPGGGWGNTVVHETSTETLQRIEEMKSEIQRLESELKSAREEVEQERAQKVEKLRNLRVSSTEEIKPPANRPLGAHVLPSVPELELLAANVLSTFSKNQTPALMKDVEIGKRAGGDGTGFQERVWIAIHMLGSFGISNLMELNQLIATPTNAKSNTGSVVEVTNDLETQGFVKIEQIKVEHPETTLSVIQLTGKGNTLFQKLFPSTELKKSEYIHCLSMLENDSHRAVKMMYLTSQARKRGYHTCLSPEVKGSNPDLWIGKGEENLYTVLAESPSDERPTAIAPLNNGKICFCALEESVTKKMIEKFSTSGAGGYATTLEAIIKEGYSKLNSKNSLWKMTW